MPSCSYSPEVLRILLLMVLFGSLRTIFLKVYFTVGVEDPFFVTILLLLGNSTALPFYWVTKYLFTNEDDKDDNSKHPQEEDTKNEPPSTPPTPPQRHQPERSTSSRGLRGSLASHSQHRSSVARLLDMSAHRSALMHLLDDESFVNQVTQEQQDRQQSIRQLALLQHVRGSTTGLSQESLRATRWVEKVPLWAVPVITGIFGACDVGFRVLATFYLAASVAELLSNGLDLVAGVLAARIIRRRHILPQRWCGVAVAVLGLTLIAASEFTTHEESDESKNDETKSSKDTMLGLIFTLLKILSASFKDILQELFTQQRDFPAPRLLGIEGLYGAIMALVVYLALGNIAGYPLADTLNELGSSQLAMAMTFVLILVTFFAALYSIWATTVTSAMTKNMWKNMRGLVVFAIGLLIYYGLDTDDLGEEWTIPGSLMILGGFTVLMFGIHIYYRTSASFTNDAIPEEQSSRMEVIDEDAACKMLTKTMATRRSSMTEEASESTPNIKKNDDDDNDDDDDVCA